MSSSIRVADLFAAMQVRIEPGTIARVDRFLNDTEGKAKKSSAKIGAHLSKAFSRLNTFVAPVVAGGVAALGYAVVKAGKDALEFDDAIVRLGIDSQNAMGSVEAMKSKILGVSSSTALAKEDVLTLAKVFVDLTGRGDVANTVLEDMARTARATGADVADVATVAATLIDNLSLDPSQLKQGMSILTAAGKAGSVSFKSMADRLAPLAAQMSEFSGGKGVEGLASVGAAMQLVNRDLKSPEKSATSLAQLMTKLVGNAGALGKAGIRVFDVDKDGKKTPRAMLDLLDDIGNSKLAKDPELLQKVLGSDEAARAARALMRVKDEWRALSRAIRDAKDIDQDFATASTSSLSQIRKSWNEVENSATAAFTPDRLQALVKLMDTLVAAAAKLVDLLAAADRWTDQLTGTDTQGGTPTEQRKRQIANLRAKAYEWEQSEETNGPLALREAKKLRAEADNLEWQLREQTGHKGRRLGAELLPDWMPAKPRFRSASWLATALEPQRWAVDHENRVERSRGAINAPVTVHVAVSGSGDPEAVARRVAAVVSAETFGERWSAAMRKAMSGAR